MSDPKDFVAVVDSDARKTPRRIAFITKRTSPQVRVKDEERVMTYPEVFFRAVVAIEVLAIALVVTSLLLGCAARGAGRSHAHAESGQGTLVLPRVAGIAALFPAGRCRRAHTRSGGDGADCHPLLQHQRRSRRTCGCATRQSACGSSASSSWSSVFSWRSSMSGLLLFPPSSSRHLCFWLRKPIRKQRKDFAAGWLSKPLSFWIMTWFLFELVVLTAIGTFFRGPGWSWVLPWRGSY